MSAKDPRRAVQICVPAHLRRFLWAERARGRSKSASAALRRIVERQLPYGYADLGIPDDATGQIYFLQLGRSSREQILTTCHERGITVSYLLIQLVAAAHMRENKETAPGVSRHRPQPIGREMEGTFC